MPVRTADWPEARYRELRGAIYEGDGRRVTAALADEVPGALLRIAGDGLLLALEQGLDGVAQHARAVSTALQERRNEGDEELADQLDASLGIAPSPMLRPLPVDLEELSSALEGDPRLTGGRLDLRSGEVITVSPMFDSSLKEGDDDDLDDPDRWVHVDSEGSRPGYEDMASFLDTIDDGATVERLRDRLQGRGAFRRFKDGLQELGELQRFHRFADDRGRGRARAWLAARGYRPALPVRR
jgi:hypothetical protein